MSSPSSDIVQCTLCEIDTFSCYCRRSKYEHKSQLLPNENWLMQSFCFCFACFFLFGFILILMINNEWVYGHCLSYKLPYMVRMHSHESRTNEGHKKKSKHCVITMTMRGCTFFNYVLRCQKASRRRTLLLLHSQLHRQRTFFGNFTSILKRRGYCRPENSRSGREINEVNFCVLFRFGHKLPHTYHSTIHHGHSWQPFSHRIAFDLKIVCASAV